MLHLISGPGSRLIRGRIIFAHGLGGHHHATWQIEPKSIETFWPSWLAEELQVEVRALEYDASPSGWHGSTMPLFDRAKNVLTEFEARELTGAPIVFICHSLGGLLVTSRRLAPRGCANARSHISLHPARRRAVGNLSEPHRLTPAIVRVNKGARSARIGAARS
jgi:hypothetical protein